MLLRTTYFVILLALASVTAFSQKKKEIKKYHLLSTASTITLYEDGKELTRPEDIEKYDKNGNCIEAIRYDHSGNITERTLCKFNRYGDQIEEIVLDATNKQLSRRAYQLDNRGAMVQEMRYDGENELDRKYVYTLDKRGLRTEKRAYNSQGVLLYLKKYKYEQ